MSLTTEMLKIRFIFLIYQTFVRIDNGFPICVNGFSKIYSFNIVKDSINLPLFTLFS